MNRRIFSFLVMVSGLVFGIASDSASAQARLHRAPLYQRIADESGPTEACAGMSAQDRATNIWTMAARSSVQRVTRREHYGKAPAVRTAGARVFVPAAPGLSAESLQRTATCQLAQHAAEGHADRTDPLAVSGIRVDVTSAGNGFYLTVMADAAADAREVVRRANALLQ